MGTGFILSAKRAIKPNIWYHVGFSIDADTGKLYTNGVLEAKIKNTAARLYDPTYPVYLGTYDAATYGFRYKGAMDDLWFFNRRITDAEMYELYSKDYITTSIKENRSGGPVNIYPNPTTGKVSIDLNSEKPVTVSVFNLLGGQLFEQNSVITKQLNINLEEQPAGIYLLKINTAGSVNMYKIVKE